MAVTKNTIIADRYAEALVKTAREGKLTFEKINDDLKLVETTLNQSKDLQEFLTTPLVSIDDKKEVLDKVFSNDIDTLIVNFLKVLIDKNRFELFDDVLESFNKSMDSINNISRVKVTSAVEMTEDAKKKLKTKLEEKLKKNVVFDLEINSDIIAGLVIKIGDNIVDMSLKHKLEDLSKNILK